MLLALPASADTFRFFGSAGAESKLTPANEASPLNPGNVAEIPLQTNAGDVTLFVDATPESRAWKVHLKLRADASYRTSSRGEVGEAYVQFNARKWLDITAGRVIEKWGTAYAWNPTSFVGPAKDPADPNDRRSAYRGIDMLRAGMFVRNTSISLYAMERGALAARVYRMIAYTDVSLYARRDDEATRQGLSVSRVFGDALELHAEGARVAHDDQRAVIRTVAGGQYTFRNNLNVVMEVYHGTDGLTASEWTDFKQCAGRQAPCTESISLADANRRFAPLRMARTYGFLRMSFPHAMLDSELIVITNLRDGSSLVRGSITKKLRRNITASLIDTEFFGPQGSEMSFIQIERELTFGVRVYF